MKDFYRLYFVANLMLWLCHTLSTLSIAADALMQITREAAILGEGGS